MNPCIACNKRHAGVTEYIACLERAVAKLNHIRSLAKQSQAYPTTKGGHWESLIDPKKHE